MCMRVRAGVPVCVLCKRQAPVATSHAPASLLKILARGDSW